jgi:hypothetical protein
MKYRVGIQEVHVRTVEVEAESAREARGMAGNAPPGDEVDVEYSHTLDEDTWDVEEAGE